MPGLALSPHPSLRATEPVAGTRSTGLVTWLLMAAMWLGALSWIRPLSSPAEGRHAGIARAMLASGDWLVPRLDGLPFLEQPPLFHWLSAASMGALGIHEWAARLPSLLGALIGAAALAMFLRRHDKRLLAELTLVVLCTMPFWFLGAQFASPDMLGAGCIGVAVLAAADALMARAVGRPWRGALALAWAGAGLGVLAQGLSGLLLPALVLVVWTLMLRRGSWLRRLCWAPGWLLMLGLAAPWFVAMQMRFPDFLAYFAIEQSTERYALARFHGAQPFWFHLPVIAGLCLPWTVLAAAWLAPPVRRGGRGAARGREIDLLMLVWLLAVLLVASQTRCKSIGDVLPALPPLAALLARGISSMGFRLRCELQWPVAGAALMCIGILLLARTLGSPADARLALSMIERPGPSDRVVMLGRYYDPLPFYWRLEQPAVLADDWRPAVVRRREGWRRKIAQAARFDPLRSRALLQSVEEQPAWICAGGRTWVVGPSNSQLEAPWVKGMTLVAFNRDIAVWRHDAGTGLPANCLDGPGVSGALPPHRPLP